MKRCISVLNRLVVLSTFVGFAAMSGVAVAGDAAAGKAKSGTCVACHGPKGISPNDIWPNLAGQKKGYLVKQMKAFRDGQRKDPVMSPMAAGLSDKDIENLAAYYSEMK
ncbi:c-type cytochrome [Exilibacterium tricleocarpae]|nr:cytochrome c [Exilibacterium tricleocarpae]